MAFPVRAGTGARVSARIFLPELGETADPKFVVLSVRAVHNLRYTFQSRDRVGRLR